jgi:uncharacterized protein (UPF0332 family)
MTSGIEALFTKARESLAAAELLTKDGYYDFAASRAYYAMFYVASALLADLGQSYSSHAAVISAFGREFATAGRLDTKYHRWLIDAQDLRNIGDYGVGSQVPKGYNENIVVNIKK